MASNREGVLSLKAFWGTIKDVFGFTPAEKEIDQDVAKEVAALRAESEKDISALESKFAETKDQKRQSFQKGIKEEVKPVEHKEKTKSRGSDKEDERI